MSPGGAACVDALVPQPADTLLLRIKRATGAPRPR